MSSNDIGFQEGGGAGNNQDNASNKGATFIDFSSFYALP